MKQSLLRHEAKSIIAVLTALVLSAVMVVTVPGVTTWAADYNYNTIPNNAGDGVVLWDTAPGGGPQSSGTIKVGETLSACIGEFSPWVLNDIANYATVVSTTTAGGNVTTLYRFTKNASFSCDGRNIIFTPGPADEGGAGGNAADVVAVVAMTPEQEAYAAFHDHAHNDNMGGFVWDASVEVSEYADGEATLHCPDCGYVQRKEPISAYDYFNFLNANRIRVAKAGQTIKINAGQWISFEKELVDALRTRQDITVVIDYKYQGNKYTLTIPQGTDYSGVPEDKYTGLVYLGGCLQIEPATR